VLILYNGPTLFSLKIAHSHGDLDSVASHLIHGSLGPPESTIVTDRPLNRRTMNATTHSVTTGRIGLRSTAMRPNIICSIDQRSVGLYISVNY